MTSFDARRVRNEIVAWIRDWFANNGPQASAVIGISGGKDSTITAALLTEALGKDRVIGVLMPQGTHPLMTNCLSDILYSLNSNNNPSYVSSSFNILSPIRFSASLLFKKM